MANKPLMVEAVSVEVLLKGEALAEQVHVLHPLRDVPQRDAVKVYANGEWHDAALVVREDLRPGDVLQGPAIIAEKMPRPSSSLVGRRGCLLLTI